MPDLDYLAIQREIAAEWWDITGHKYNVLPYETLECVAHMGDGTVALIVTVREVREGRSTTRFRRQGTKVIVWTFGVAGWQFHEQWPIEWHKGYDQTVVREAEEELPERVERAAWTRMARRTDQMFRQNDINTRL